MGISMYAGKDDNPAGWFCVEGPQLAIKEFSASSPVRHKTHLLSVRFAQFIGELQVFYFMI
jgi:hypothetical protein